MQILLTRTSIDDDGMRQTTSSLLSQLLHRQYAYAHL
jgi:hypothetical protein